MFFFNRSSDDRDQLASASKSFVTTLLALPNEKSLADTVTVSPIPIALSVVDGPLVLYPIKIF